MEDAIEMYSYSYYYYDYYYGTYRTGYSSTLDWAWFFLILLLCPCYIYFKCCHKDTKPVDTTISADDSYKTPDGSSPPPLQVHYGQMQPGMQPGMMQPGMM